MAVKNRCEIEEKFKWDLSSMFVSDEAWNQTFQDVQNNLNAFDVYKGKLKDKNVLLELFKKDDEISVKIENLYTYAKMRSDEDTSLGLYTGMFDKVQTLAVALSSVTAWIIPEISQSYSTKQLKDLSDEEAFSDYSYKLSEIARNKKIIKSEKEEKIMTEASLMSSSFRTAFSLFDNADVEFKPIKDENGKMEEVTHGTYSAFIQSTDRRVRKAAFESMFTPYKQFGNTLAGLYSGNVKADWFYAKQRGFSRCLDYAVYGENVPSVIYENLIEEVHSAIKYLNKYLTVKKGALHLRDMHWYDMYVSVAGDIDKKYTYQEAQELIKEAVKPLGEDYVKILSRAFEERWIDVYENKNKRSGAYSWGTYSSNPFILTNFNGGIHDVFTLAHELGHSMHSYFSHLSQPYAKGEYTIFVAEVASTVNETLLLKYLLGKSTDPKTRIYLLSYYLEMFRTTVFRQSMFAEFELIAHKMIENGEPATKDTLSAAYYSLNELYYGKSIVVDDLIRYEWERIPHFYTSFYVYKYATGLLSAVYIAENILAGNEEVKTGYRKFLCAGGSMPPADILKMAGVDLTKKKTFDYSFKRFAAAVNELKEELKK